MKTKPKKKLGPSSPSKLYLWIPRFFFPGKPLKYLQQSFVINEKYLLGKRNLREIEIPINNLLWVSDFHLKCSTEKADHLVTAVVQCGRHHWGPLDWRDNVGFVPLVINLLSMFHSDERGQHEYPIILSQLRSHFATGQNALPDKAGINDNTPKRGNHTKRLEKTF